ncbi:lactonase family protein [Luteimicrobium subarcticum]|uniref:6-phosphogluconolactonase (Cycloisomerase 2 family) n=1 Tax=Luteimicrobium subarcticum TaxID=620910 RepID=A0A2M8WSM3_9MICO|nr:beta-propeller fold lactonase family protein [Luteimicrobium subarcticum]PJI93955.1 6-phosphogluconolactonase (cycloisomerase 2 family) [Luteimicrobium subarcticum]
MTPSSSAGDVAPAHDPSHAAVDAVAPAPSTRRLWVGTYPADDDAPGAGEGVWSVELDLASGGFGAAQQVVRVTSPSFVALTSDERTLYAVTETADGAVSAFRSSPGSDDLALTAAVPTHGDFPCHVVAEGDTLWVANYGTGGFATVPLAADGSFAGDGGVHAGEGTGPVTDRQEGPHAHYAVAGPDGAAWVVDLGADRVRRYVPTGDGAVRAAGTVVTLPAGAGPRHLVVAPERTPGAGFAFVVGELDDQVHVLETGTDADGHADATWRSAVPAHTTAAPAEVRAFPSHVALSPDGARLYLTVRGPDVLATFDVVRDADGVRLVHRADTPLVGVWPRHFAVLDTPDGDVVVVAGQTSSTLEALRVDAASGRAEVVASLTLPRPACVVERRILEG